MQFDRITHDPAIMGGKPCIRGLRMTVGTILGLLATAQSRNPILEAYPYLEPEDIDAALTYAAWRLEEREESKQSQHGPENQIMDMSTNDVRHRGKKSWCCDKKATLALCRFVASLSPLSLNSLTQDRCASDLKPPFHSPLEVFARILANSHQPSTSIH